MLRRFSINYALFTMFLDVSFTLLALWLAGYIRAESDALISTEPLTVEAAIPPLSYILAPLLWLSIFLLFSVYDPRRTYKAIDELQTVVVVAGIASLTTAGLLYLFERDFSRNVFVTFVIANLGFLVGWRVIARLFFRMFKGRTFAPRHVLIVGAGEVGQRVAGMLRAHAWTGLQLAGYLDDDPAKMNIGLPILGTLDQARAIVGNVHITEVVVTLPRRAYEKVNRLTMDLLDLPVNVRVIPDYFSLALHRATMDDFGGIPMINLRAPALNEYQRLIKRAFDLVVGTLLLIVCLPIMAIIAVAIKLDSTGTVLFKQQRAGENGRLFMMYKFRSMVPDADQQLPEIVTYTDDGQVLYKSKDDPRITRVGKFIRRTSLDELPQLFNVLSGKMSLVGPRPELPWLVERYESWQRKRFAVPQGMTGWWQVNGRSDKPMHLHTEDDFYYIQNYSLLLDLYIIWKTIGVVLGQKGSF